jgi:Zn-dependent protease
VLGSLRAGRIFGIPLLVHWSLALVALLIAANLARVASGDDGFTLAGTVVGVIAALAFFISILGHELAHALVARRYRVGTESITLWALGGLAQLADEPRSARAQGWIAAAGPAASLVFGGLLVGMAYGLFALGVASGTVTVVAWLGLINGLIAVFNLLPGSPLDGGRIVAAWRWGRHGDRYRAMREAAGAGRYLGWLVAGVGVWLFATGRNGLFIVLTGAFIAINASAEAASAEARGRLRGLAVGDLTRFGIAHAHLAIDASTMLWQRHRLGPPRVVAVDDDLGTTLGLVTEEQLWDVPPDLRTSTRLGDLAVPLTKFGRVSPDEPLDTAVTKMRPLHPMLTVWRGDLLVGVVPSDQIRARLGTGA